MTGEREVGFGTAFQLGKTGRVTSQSTERLAFGVAMPVDHQHTVRISWWGCYFLRVRGGPTAEETADVI